MNVSDIKINNKKEKASITFNFTMEELQAIKEILEYNIEDFNDGFKGVSITYNKGTQNEFDQRCTALVVKEPADRYYSYDKKNLFTDFVYMLNYIDFPCNERKTIT